MIQQCIDLALGRAFTPDPLDTAVPLARRFARRPLLALSVYKDGLEIVPITFEGDEPKFGPAEFRTTAGEDADTAFVRAAAERHKARECLINLTYGYTAVLSSRARRPDSDEEAILLMRDNPERILGESPAQGCRHSLAFHPTHNFATVFAHREAEINAAAALAARAELGVARLQCGASSLLSYVIGQSWPEVHEEAELLFVDRASLFYLPVAEGSFGRPLFDIGLREATHSQAVAERIGKLKSGGRVILINASPLDVAGMIREAAPSTTVVEPLKGPAHPFLLACCSDRPRLGHDLFPGERTVRPFAPARLRVVPIVFWGSVAAAVAIVGMNTFRQTQDERLARGLTSQVQMLEVSKKQSETVIHDSQARAKTANSICNWLLISPSTEALLVGLTHEIEGATAQGAKEGKSIARLDSLSLARQEGQPQMRLTLVVIGDAQAANRIFQRVSALFGRMGYSTVDLKETLVPMGFRYEHLLNLPSP